MLPPISTAGLTSTDRRRLRDRVRAEMEATLGPGSRTWTSLRVPRSTAANMPSRDDDWTFVGEALDVDVRLVLSPDVGVLAFTALRPSVTLGDVIAEVRTLSGVAPVSSWVSGDLAGMLARTGERVQRQQPIAWLNVAPNVAAG